MSCLTRSLPARTATRRAHPCARQEPACMRAPVACMSGQWERARRGLRECGMQLGRLCVGRAGLASRLLVTFIPRIGDFGLATKSTLEIRSTTDEYAFVTNSQRSQGSSRGRESRAGSCFDGDAGCDAHVECGDDHVCGAGATDDADQRVQRKGRYLLAGDYLL
ncbi:hypothetical protein DL89DRAFT_63889 [Linderina pennispora]|uniref:Uncharacterized protein n=1 Tax=Linderina pennispora TaxID=61395 RepID=A0A1Y1VYW2_9FUNG|nr:uncharacterized protein DL89DRAFT_63889 [Linderina pennispora]ORX66449.1 hypothetical protein DL89DRAFT_63889 [Linderina pennispora]